MRLQINSIELVGADRAIEFEDGLNIITGEITTGKTTLVDLVRGILGAAWHSFTPEVQATTSSVKAELVVGNDRYLVQRPLTTSTTSLFDVYSIETDVAVQLPIARSSAVHPRTYGDWLLAQLGLQRLSVPGAPTQPDSDPTSVTISDYLNYCYVPQTAIGSEIFQHRNPFRNIKRQYVFQILFGVYGPETAALQAELREVTSELRALSMDERTFTRLLEGTALGDRAELENELALTERGLAELTERAEVLASESVSPAGSPVERQRDRLIEYDRNRSERRSELARVEESVRRLQELREQLIGQQNRLARSIVAGTLLLDIEFRVCPRCGAMVEQGRGDDQLCMLCLQHPNLEFDRETLSRERDRLTAQIAETDELIEEELSNAEEYRTQLAVMDSQRSQLAEELDVLTRTFVSDNASILTSIAAEGARLREARTRILDYLEILDRFRETSERRVYLQERQVELEGLLDADRSRIGDAELRINRFEDHFSKILDSFHAPQLGEGKIDRKTYLPMVGERDFDHLSSAGWKSLVNLAYSLAVHETAIELKLPLPGLLIIDRPSTHIGHEGLDLERIQHIYEYLAQFAEVHADDLQLIVVDNDVPDSVKPYIRARFSGADRLVPDSVVRRAGEFDG